MGGRAIGPLCFSTSFRRVIERGVGRASGRPLHLTAYRLCDDPDLIHELPELIWIERLGTVGASFWGVGVYLYHQSIRARGNGGPCHRNDLRPNPRPVTRISDDREVGKGFHDGDRREIQQIARVRIETSNTALTQDHPFVSFRQDILGG